MRTCPALFLLCMMISYAPGLVLAQEDNAKLRYNILVLLADDMRWDALGCMGNKIVYTPHLDELARQGIRFTNAFVTTSICAPSRASIFSGQYVRRHGIDDFQKSFSTKALQQTYPLLLKKAGYRIGFIGKWGVGNELPREHFDYWARFRRAGYILQRFWYSSDSPHGGPSPGIPPPKL